MDKIKRSFLRVGEDIKQLREELNDLNLKLNYFLAKLEGQNTKNLSTDEHEKKTTPTHNPTHHYHFKPVKAQILGISTGNGGVPTNKQTNKQTDRQTDKYVKNEIGYSGGVGHFEKNLFEEKNERNAQIFEDLDHDNFVNSIDKATELLNSLDNIKKEIRIKFKRLTNQEMVVFSTIYQLEEEKGGVTYSDVAKTLKLSESSIRDYVRRLIKKGIPVEKKRKNNKNILLGISTNLKKMTHLSTIIRLREI